MSITIEIAAVALSALTAATGGALSALGSRIVKLKTSDELKEKGRDLKAEVRLKLVHSMLMREIERCRIFRLASMLLVFSQFVVGGLLASTFVTKALGDSIVGLLGLVVLAASLINQHFRPDLLHKTSADKLRRLRTLNRKLEDELYVATKSGIRDADLIRIRLLATESLEQIETSEHMAVQNDKQNSA